MIIPNGFNIDKFKFDESIRTSIRNSMGITEKEIVIGMVARFHPHKDHRNFINACSILIKHLPILRIILIGDNVSPKNVELNNLLLENRLHDKTFLLGRRDDVANYLSAFDIGVLSSSGEAFPNVLGEMMACELPCVTTDVGDTKEIIGDCGLVVPSKDPLKLANAILQLALKSSISRRELGKKSRQRIFKFYNIETISNKYLSLYYNVLEKYKTRLK
jgi:glycosyltransferase involved in cell wall biosynthesis